MKVLVCGDRNYHNRKAIEDRLCGLPKGSTIISGGCRGADSLAELVAEQLGFRACIFPANWSKFGKAAGPIRNSRMLEESPDLVIAFHSNLDKSRGTVDTVRKARKMNIPVEVIA